MAAQLVPGDAFPQLSLQVAGGDTLVLPDELSSTYTIVLFYRGHW